MKYPAILARYRHRPSPAPLLNAGIRATVFAGEAGLIYALTSHLRHHSRPLAAVTALACSSLLAWLRPAHRAVDGFVHLLDEVDRGQPAWPSDEEPTVQPAG